MAEHGAPESIEDVVGEILEYLVKHPDAKDTPEGICKWWKPKGQPEWRQDQLQRALDRLLSKGWLIVRELSPPQKVYGINKKHIQEIKECLLNRNQIRQKEGFSCQRH